MDDAAIWEEQVTERILTLHPAGKQGVNIDKGKYDMVREAIEETLKAQPGITFSEHDGGGGAAAR